jgi:hypothetical protein
MGATDMGSWQASSKDLVEAYGTMAASFTGTASADVVIVSGDLSQPFAWGLVGDFLGHHIKAVASLDLTATAVPEDISSLDAYVPVFTGGLIKWGSYWKTLSGQTGLKINVTLNGLTSAYATNANKLLKVFAGAGGEYTPVQEGSASSVKGLADTDTVSFIPLNTIALISTDLAIPKALKVDELKIDAKSVADFRDFGGPDFVTFATTTLKRFAFEDKAKLILPNNITKEDEIAAIEALAKRLPEGETISALELEVNGETKSADEILNPKSSSGCDAGFGLGGVLLLAGAALIGRKRG